MCSRSRCTWRQSRFITNVVMGITGVMAATMNRGGVMDTAPVMGRCTTSETSEVIGVMAGMMTDTKINAITS